MMTLIISISLMTLIALTFVILPIYHLEKNILSRRKLIFIFITILPLLSLSCYWKYGAASQLLAKQRLETARMQLGPMENIIKKLEQHLQEDPQSARGWYLLGRLYLKNADYTRAVAALAKANELQPQQTDTMLSYAEALYFTNQQSLNTMARSLLKDVLKTDPKNVNVMNLLAIDAYHHQRYQEAIQYWEKLLAQFPAGSEDAKALSMMLQNARQKLKEK